MKQLSLTLLLTILVASSASAKKIDLGLDIVSMEVTNMPFEIRNVPVHPDDGSGLPGPIERLNYPIKGIFNLGYPLKKIEKGNSTIILKVRLILYPTTLLYDDAERNYTNAPGTEQHGEGAALTRVGLEVRGIVPGINILSGWIDTAINLTPEIVWETPATLGKMRLALSASYFNLQAFTGWDRYNIPQIKDRYILAHCFPIGATLRSDRGLSMGIRWYPMFKTRLGKESGLKNQNFGVIFSYQY